MLIFLIISIVALYIFSKKYNLRTTLTSFSKNEKLMSIEDKYNSKKVAEQKELNILLEKINKKGHPSLSTKEKSRLDELSKK